jgi:hypothetical protein
VKRFGRGSTSSVIFAALPFAMDTVLAGVGDLLLALNE